MSSKKPILKEVNGICIDGEWRPQVGRPVKSLLLIDQRHFKGSRNSVDNDIPVHKSTSARLEQGAAKHADVVQGAIGGMWVVAELLRAIEVNLPFGSHGCVSRLGSVPGTV